MSLLPIHYRSAEIEEMTRLRSECLKQTARTEPTPLPSRVLARPALGCLMNRNTSPLRISRTAARWWPAGRPDNTG